MSDKIELYGGELIYDFNKVKQIKGEGAACLCLYNPADDTCILQCAKSSYVNIPGGGVDNKKDHLMNDNGKIKYQQVPYGNLLDWNEDIEKKIVSIDEMENVVCAAVRELYEETEIYAYFVDDEEEIPKGINMRSDKTYKQIPCIIKTNGRQVRQYRDFIPIKFMVAYKIKQ